MTHVLNILWLAARARQLLSPRVLASISCQEDLQDSNWSANAPAQSVELQALSNKKQTRIDVWDIVITSVNNFQESRNGRLSNQPQPHKVLIRLKWNPQLRRSHGCCRATVASGTFAGPITKLGRKIIFTAAGIWVFLPFCPSAPSWGKREGWGRRRGTFQSNDVASSPWAKVKM